MIKKTILSASILAVVIAMSAEAEPITVLTSGNRLLTVDSASPRTTTESAVTVSGLASGETLRAIDYRPATGILHGLGSSNRIYSINADTGVATAIGTGGAFTLNGTSFGFDFNPQVDRIRITSDTDQNLRANPNDGTVVTDGTLAYTPSDPNNGANPNIVGSGYVNNFSGAGATTLRGIDSNLDILAIQAPPNEGGLVTVGPLGVDTTDTVGFDVSGLTGVAFAALTPSGVGGVTQLYTINLLTGAATPTNSTSAIIAPAALGTETVVDIAAFVNPGSRLDNISTRGRVGISDQDYLIAGFISRGGVSSRILVRAIGPSLSSRGVTGALPDPSLELFNNDGMSIATNDDFGSSDQKQEIEATGLAPQNQSESAILRSLPPGLYTAVVSGKGGSTGVALVEVYQLQQ